MVCKKHGKTHSPFRWSLIILLMVSFSTTLVAGDIPDGPVEYNPDAGKPSGDDDHYPPAPNPPITDDDDGDDRPTYVIIERERECSRDDYGDGYCEHAHNQCYRSCRHWDDRGDRRGPAGRVWVEDDDGGGWMSDDEWRERDRRRRSCESRYHECSAIPCHSRYSEFRRCEDEMRRHYSDRRRRGRAGDDCYNCGNQSTYAENVSAWLNPLAYLGGTLGTAYLGYKGQKAHADAWQNGQKYWADAYVAGHEQCTARFNSHHDYNITRGGNPILADQATKMMEVCNDMQFGGAGMYAGMNGLIGNGYGGFGNPWHANGFSSGFLNGMMGPYAGAGGQLSAGIHLGFGGNFGGGALRAPGHPGYGGYLGHYGPRAPYPGYGAFTGGGVTIAGSAGLGQYYGINGGYPGMTGRYFQGGWNPHGGGSAWGNHGGWAGHNYWQGQNSHLINQHQNYHASTQFANSRNIANYQTGGAAGYSLLQNYNQAVGSYNLGMQHNPSGFYGSAPYNYGYGMHGNFSYGGGGW